MIEIIKIFRKRHKLSKERLARELGVTARTIYRWERGISEPSVRIVERFKKLRFRIVAQLTDRELEVLKLIAQDKTTSEIADNLFISKDTIKTHVSNICKKLMFKNREEVKRYAIQQGLGD